MIYLAVHVTAGLLTFLLLLREWAKAGDLPQPGWWKDGAALGCVALVVLIWPLFLPLLMLRRTKR